jgi:DNA-binding GntR family transcriptional regulator
MDSSDRLPKPLERVSQTFSDRTVEVLRDTVISGRLRPGERLNEVELANALGISRGPLREAIQRLHSERLLTTVPNRGAFVRVITPAELSQLYEVRIALESHALRLAAKNADAGEIDELNRVIDAALSVPVPETPYPPEPDFHQRLIALTDNEALAEAAGDVRRQIGLARAGAGAGAGTGTLTDPRRAEGALAEHREITDQLARRRGDAAAKALERHLRSNLAGTLRAMRENGLAAGHL